MAAFLYYLPGLQQPASREIIKSVGLSYAIDSPTSSEVMGPSLPDGGRGQIVADRRLLGVDGTLTYLPDLQEWHKHPKADAYIGWWKESPPTPRDLQREEITQGVVLRMADGNEWEIPMIRDVDNGRPSCLLPAVHRAGPDGRMVRADPIPRLRKLWDDTAWTWDAMVEDRVLSDEEAQRLYECAGFIFGTNYHVSIFELWHLGVFSDELNEIGLVAEVNSIRQYLRWVEDQKKTEKPEAD